jgi:hypothetical protein
MTARSGGRTAEVVRLHPHRDGIEELAIAMRAWDAARPPAARRAPRRRAVAALAALGSMLRAVRGRRERR